MLISYIVNTLIVAAAVGFHFEMLNWLSKKVPIMTINNRARVVVALLGAIFAHLIEIWLFAFAYYAIIYYDKMGALEGNFDGSLYDCFYFSITTYTTVGYGDIAPLGDVRLLAGLESLTGLVLITWTASFLFVEMQKLWIQENNK
ncbi:MAG: two pore domain potassium channel family protein [Gammaproteobacteria bacterium]|nr:two pore domain potassium channel family protein [Gammaproteobacteria bacterium]